MHKLKKDTDIRRFDCTKYRGVETQQENESSVAVKSIPDAATKGMKHHIKGCLEDNSSDSIILQVGTNNL